MSWIVTNYPTTPLSELRPANPFHDGFKSLREGDWQFFGTRHARVLGWGLTGFSVAALARNFMGLRAMPFGYPRTYWVGHVLFGSIGMAAGYALHDLEMKSRGRIDLQREVLRRQRLRDLGDLKRAAEESVGARTQGVEA